jgi:hypothetical protein
MIYTKWNRFSVAQYFIVLACALQALLVGAKEKYMDDLPIVNAKNQTINYAGVINKKGAALVLEFINTNLYKELHIISGGGEITSAMEIGSAVFDKKMNVTVSHFCNSSCANYVFPAGENKKINEGAFVLWHGDARQRNFIETGNKLLERSSNNNDKPLSEEEQKRLLRHQENLRMQDAFYAKIGINGSIARIGQEIENWDKRAWLWALPVSTMNAFGIKNIDAPSDYGTTEYCEIKSKKYYPKKGPRCLSISEKEIKEWNSMIENK